MGQHTEVPRLETMNGENKPSISEMEGRVEEGFVFGLECSKSLIDTTD